MSPELERLQRWMQEVVVHPGSVEEAIASPSAELEIPANRLTEVVLPSETMTPSERVGVYHGMYLMRMEEALETDYPVIRYHLGDVAFSHLVEAYVGRYPSRSTPSTGSATTCRSSSSTSPTGRRPRFSTISHGSSWR